MAERAVIVGASVGGIRTAQALRAEGYEGPIVVVGDEAELPYDRPPLSKQILTGTWDLDRIALITESDAAEAGIELRLGVAAAGLVLNDRRVVLEDGSSLTYDTLVIATGLSAREPSWPVESGLFVLRTLRDSAALRTRFQPGVRVVFIGAGFIGAEAASAARAAGCEVTLVDVEPVPMGRVAGAAIGAQLSQLHERRGVQTRFGVGVRAITGTEGALSVHLDDGTELDAAIVVAGLGAVPNVGWLAGSGLPVDDGVLCDEYLRVDGGSSVYACGDIARFPQAGLGRAARTEHWTNAADQARCVAHNIVHPGQPTAYRPSNYAWSDQYDWKLQVVGSRAAAATEELIGNLLAERPQVASLYADANGVLCGAVVLNWPRALVLCRRLVADGGELAAVREQLAPAREPGEPTG
jgi:NADPH-dependent 2,4-dienoyl-CoA reductase/sulfur reductase-like enzyme